jgi:hypothetical protein
MPMQAPMLDFGIGRAFSALPFIKVTAWIPALALKGSLGRDDTLAHPNAFNTADDDDTHPKMPPCALIMARPAT